MTVDTPQLLARYNAHANREMNKILASLSPADWNRDLGGYYSSFRTLVGHLYTVDVAWLNRFTGLRPFQAIRGDVFDFPPTAGQPPFEGFPEYQERRTALDATLVAFVAELTPADLSSELSYRNFRGEEITKNFGDLVLHLFNHQTHHRGMVALYLDQLDIPNDFASLTALV